MIERTFHLNLGTPHPEARIEIKNFGQTPASDVTHAAKLFFLDFPNSQNHKIITAPKPSRDVVAPNGSLFLHTVYREGLEGTKWTELAEGKKALYLIGCVTYKDIFGEIHETEYCHYVGGDFRSSEDGFARAHEGNIFS